MLWSSEGESLELGRGGLEDIVDIQIHQQPDPNNRSEDDKTGAIFNHGEEGDQNTQKARL